MRNVKSLLAFFLHLFLFLLAWALLLPLTLITYLVVCFKSSPKGYFIGTALNLDKFANREFRTLWNNVLIKKSGYQFGHIEETISGVLGKNKRDGTLSFVGKALATLLDFLDKNHCIKSIDETITWNQ